jgi:hypothetical protein
MAWQAFRRRPRRGLRRDPRDAFSDNARYTGYRFPAEIISHAVWLYFRFPLGLRMALGEDEKVVTVGAMRRAIAEIW